MVVQHDLDRQAGEGFPHEAETRLRVRCGRLPVAGAVGNEHHQPVDRQTLQRGPRERDVTVVRGIEGAAEDAG
jgi:hypothetical protein